MKWKLNIRVKILEETKQKGPIVEKRDCWSLQLRVLRDHFKHILFKPPTFLAWLFLMKITTKHPDFTRIVFWISIESSRQHPIFQFSLSPMPQKVTNAIESTSQFTAHIIPVKKQVIATIIIWWSEPTSQDVLHSCYAPLRRPYENWPKEGRQQKPICTITDLFIPALFFQTAVSRKRNEIF